MNLTERWISDRGLRVVDPKRENQELEEELNFRYDGRTVTGIGFSIVQPKAAPRTVLALSRVEIAPNHFGALKSMKTRRFEDFLLDLRKELVLAPAMFLLIPPQGVPQSVQFAKEVSFDELTEGKLIEAVNNIVKCTILLILLFNKKFGPGAEVKS